MGRRLTDRYVFLFDGLMILTKQNKSRISVTGPVGDYKLKEKYHVRLLDITDRDDTDGMFDIYSAALKTVIFYAICRDMHSSDFLPVHCVEHLEHVISAFCTQ